MVKAARPKRAVYIPERGDLVWLMFDPQSGHEQAGRRPALTLSPRSYNAKAGLALFCPITSRIKGYPFEVALPARGKITGAVLCDQIKSLDWQARQAKLIASVSPDIMAAVIARCRALIV